MHAHEYGGKHFKHKTNFEDLVVFSDVQQNKIKEKENVSPFLYVEIEKGVQNPDKWFLHVNSTLSGEYGDFYLKEKPEPVEEIVNSFDYDISPENTAFIESFYDFNAGKIAYYKINEKFYIKVWGNIAKEEAFFNIQNSSKSRPKEEKSIEYDAFTTVFVSEDGAQLLQAYEAIKKVNAHEVVVFIERSSGSNVFGTVFRIKKGKNVKKLIETNRTRIAEVARAYGVDIITNELSKMIAKELTESQESDFYLILSSGGRIVRWGADVTFSNISKFFKSTGKEIGSLKLGDNYWKTEIDGKENPKYNPLLPKINFNKSFSSEEVANKVYKGFFAPIETSVVTFTEKLNRHWLFKELIPFKSDRIASLFKRIPEILKNFLDEIKNNLQNTYDFVNGLLVGLINSIIDFFKSIFDILAILVDVLNAVIQAGKFFEKPGHYLRMLSEGFENLIDLVLSTFTIENLKAWVKFLIYLPKATAKLLVALFTKVSNVKISIDPGALGYYIGFLVGFIASEVVTFFATGGTGTIAKGIKAVLQSYKELVTIATRTVVKTAKFTIETFFSILRKLKEFAQNIPKHFKTLTGWIDEFIIKLQSKALLVDNVAFAIADPITLFASTVFKKFKTSAWKRLNGLGVNMVKNEEGLYSFLYNGKNIAEGLIKKQAEEFLKEIFAKSKGKADDAVKKYLDEIAEGKKVRNYLIKDVPGIKYFVKWFDDLTIEEFNLVWDNVKLNKKIKRRIRYPGKLHEWLMVSRANVFKSWGVSAGEIIALRTKIKEVIFVNPPGVHGGKGSTKAHNEILKLIDGSNGYDEFVEKLINWSDKRLKGGSKKLPEGFFK